MRPLRKMPSISNAPSPQTNDPNKLAKEIYDSLDTLGLLRELEFALRLRLANQYTLETRKRTIRIQLNEISQKIMRLEIKILTVSKQIPEHDLLSLIIAHRNKSGIPPRFQ